MVRLIEVVQNGAGGHYAQLQVIDTEPFQILHFEMFQQAIVGRFGRKHPIVLLLQMKFGGEQCLHVAPFAIFVQHLFGCETIQQFFDIVECALPD